MSEQINEYLESLRTALAGCDPALVQDALADAEEHLVSALDQARSAGRPEAEALAEILEQFGSPTEVAQGYRELESRTLPIFPAPRSQPSRNPLQRFVGVLADPRAYASLFFMLFSLITGVIFFTWAVTGLSLSLGLAVLIIGVPFFGLFVFSLQGLALVEGRLVETLLGIRMPRRAASAPRVKGIWARFKARLTDPRTWTTLLYCILKLPMGVVTFSIFITLLVYGLQLILLPFVQYALGFPLLVISDVRIWVPLWFMPVLMLAGFLEIILVLHLARISGRLMGGMAKAMLVRG